MKPIRKPIFDDEGHVTGYEFFLLGESLGIAVKIGNGFRIMQWTKTLKESEAMLVAAARAR